jgi:hypothetical protein
MSGSAAGSLEGKGMDGHEHHKGRIHDRTITSPRPDEFMRLQSPSQTLTLASSPSLETRRLSNWAGDPASTLRKFRTLFIVHLRVDA